MKLNLSYFRPSLSSSLLLDEAVVVVVLVIAVWSSFVPLTKCDKPMDGKSIIDGTKWSNRAEFEKNRLGYEKIEEYLYKNVRNSEAVGPNMEAIRKLFDIELAKPDEARDKQLFSALGQFVALSKLNTGNTGCNHESYATLNGLNIATHNRVLRALSKRGPLRRIELILEEYANKHAIQCKQVYPARFERVYATLNSTILGQIDATMEGFMKKSPALRLGRILAIFRQRNDSFKTSRDARIALDSIRRLARENLEDVAILNNGVPLTSDDMLDTAKHQVKNLVEKYLLEPCKYHNDILGPDIFVPAQNDAVVLGRASRYKPGVSEQHDAFILGWARFGYCFMLQRDKIILTKKIIALALNK